MPSNIIILSDRIKELSNTTGTGNLQLEGAATGFSSFGSFYEHNALIYYAITDGVRYEVGSGQYLDESDPSITYNQLVRFPFKSTSSDGLVNFPDGVKEIYVTYPAAFSVYTASGLESTYNKPAASGFAFWETSNILNYDPSIIWDSTNNRIGIENTAPAYAIDVGGGPNKAIIRASGLITGASGVIFPSGNTTSAYIGGTQLEHFLRNELSTKTGTDDVFQLSGIVEETLCFKKQPKGYVLAGPPSGCTPTACSPAYPSFRFLTYDDIPDLSNVYVTRNGTTTKGNVAFWAEDNVLTDDDDLYWESTFNHLRVRGSETLTGDLTVGGNISVSGDMDIMGDVTYIDSSTVTIWDKHLELASMSGNAVYTDSLVDTAGIIIKSSGDGTEVTVSDKKWVWKETCNAWTSFDGENESGPMHAKVDVSGIVAG